MIGQVATTQAMLPLIRVPAGLSSWAQSEACSPRSSPAPTTHRNSLSRRSATSGVRNSTREHRCDPDRAKRDLDADLGQGDRLPRRLTQSTSPRLAPYRERLTAFRETLRSADEHGKSPSDVAEAIAHALTTEKPDTRCVVGAAGKLATAATTRARPADKLAERTAKP